MGLEEYQRKRRFASTPEPQGTFGPGAERPRFVVQEHHARRVHWDLRLEMEGVLRSWAVPKGPSLDPADKRLAVLVEDHPIEYGEFEGIIPEGNYGAGTVMLWDRGTYECVEGDPAEAFRRGKLTLIFHGEKLRGEFHFVRTKRNEGRDWLLFKGKDEFAAPGYTATGTRSVKTGRTIEEVRAEQDARWTASAPAAAAPAPSRPPSPRRALRKAPADPFPEPFRPMLAQTAEGPFSRAGWLFEIKWDGVRALGFVRRRGATQEITLYSRTLRRLNAQFPEVIEALAALAPLAGDGAVLDGEIFAPDERGRPNFARLQQRVHLSREPDVREAAGRIPVVFAVFDCLYLNGRDLRAHPLSERRTMLEGLALPAGMLRSDAVEGDGLTLFEAATQHGLEGIIAKRASSLYRPGARSADWQKIKVRRTLDAVVGGITRGKGSRKGTFGALVLGQYDPSTGALVHIGQTGGGLSDSDLRVLRRRLEPLVTKTCPFVVPPTPLQPVTWVRPSVVVEVEYSEFTPDRMLRAPVFLRVRDDIPAAEVKRRDGDGTTPAAAPPVAFTNLDKVFFPDLGLTKGDVIGYYRRIAPYLLPHLRDRPLTLRRWPDGIAGESFFQKDLEDPPAFVRTERIWSADGHRDVRMVICNDEATLLWLAQLGCIEMHAWFSRITPIPGRRDRPGAGFAGSEEAIAKSTLNVPDYVVFDIDPFLFPEGTGPTRRHGEYDPDYTRKGFEAARQAALWLGEALEGLGLRAFAKTSGKTGLHVFIPIVRRYTYAQTHAFAKTMATWLVRQHPGALTTAWSVRDRVGKVFLDYNQNVRGKTLASIYSLRPVPQATAGVPVTWDELRAGLDPLRWTITTVFDRLERVGDLWADILNAAQEIAERARG
ncbi:MAG TPA: non-homologous end-joining DNA ligase [bacterium]|nr:non-homologous end-joining DNA ligase [bacterium]